MRDTENEHVRRVSSFGKRLLCTCFRTLTSEFKEKDSETEVHPPECLGLELDTVQKANVGPVCPGIVARLMGLQSMPEPDLLPECRPIDLFLPRRSADSVYNPGRFDPLVHRQVGKSLSFRDMPTYLQDDVKELFLARAENIWQKKMRGTKYRKYEISGREVKQRVVGRGKSIRNEKQVLNETVHNGRPVSVASTSGGSQQKNYSRKHSRISKGRISNQITATDRITFPKKHTGRYLLPKDKAERRSEPVSVRPKIDLSAKETSRERPSNLRQKEQLDSQESKSSPRRRLNINSVNKKRQGCDRSTTSTKSVCYLKSKQNASKWAKEDLKWLLSKPREMWKQATLEEIGIEFEAIILDGLVHALVEELWGLHLNKMYSSINNSVLLDKFYGFKKDLPQ